MMRSDDVEMEDMTSLPNDTNQSIMLSLITSGQVDSIISLTKQKKVNTGSVSTVYEGDPSDLVTPYLPLLTRLEQEMTDSHQPNTTQESLKALLVTYEEVNNLRSYTNVLATLTSDDLKLFKQHHSASTLPLYHQFERGSIPERCCLVLNAIVETTASLTVQNMELFRNTIYTNDLISILVNALVSPSLVNMVTLQQVIPFLLHIPLGGEIIAGEGG